MGAPSLTLTLALALALALALTLTLTLTLILTLTLTLGELNDAELGMANLKKAMGDPGLMSSIREMMKDPNTMAEVRTHAQRVAPERSRSSARLRTHPQARARRLWWARQL